MAGPSESGLHHVLVKQREEAWEVSLSAYWGVNTKGKEIHEFLSLPL